MAQNQNRALSMLSIAAKAGKVQSGGFLTEKAIQEGVAYFVQKKFMDKCKYYEIPYTIAFDSTTLGRQIGKQERTVLAVTDAGLAKQISDKLD